MRPSSHLLILAAAGACCVASALPAEGSVRAGFGRSHAPSGAWASVGVALPGGPRSPLTVEGGARAPIASDAPASLDQALLAALDGISDPESEEASGLQILEDGSLTAPLKSPTKAALLSVFVPGLGQMYGGNAKLGAVYLGIEAAGWYGFSVWRTHGFDKRRDSHRFADIHYSSVVYDSIKNVDPLGYPNRPLPYGDIIEYYEDIAKLNELIWGWEDVDPEGPTVDPVTQQIIPGTSALREEYQDMRHAANDDLRKARNVGIGLFVNHVVSAFHAFKIVQWTNRRLHPTLQGYRLHFRETRDRNGYMVVVSRPF